MCCFEQEQCLAFEQERGHAPQQGQRPVLAQEQRRAFKQNNILIWDSSRAHVLNEKRVLL